MLNIILVILETLLNNIQFRSVFSGQVSSGHFRSVQVPDLIGRSGESHLSGGHWDISI
jgi:hypothetical protein